MDRILIHQQRCRVGGKCRVGSHPLQPPPVIGGLLRDLDQLVISVTMFCRPSPV